MKRNGFNLHAPDRRFCLLCLVLAAPGIFGLVPIQERSLRGASAAEARLKILAAAKSCLGVPYRYAGLDRRGMDCSGLIYHSFREGLKISVPRTAEGIYAWAEKIPASELAPGDLVFFVTNGAGVSHLGIYAGGGRFIHSASEGLRTGVIYSRLDEAYWKRTYLGAGRALPWNAEAAQAMAAAESGKTAQPAAPPSPPAEDPGVESANPESANPENAIPEGNEPESTIPENDNPVTSPLAWANSGFFTGISAAWTWGGFIEGAPSAFRGISAVATVGYKWSGYRAGLELRPEWDRALGVFRLPFTVSLGNDIIQVFAGPAYTLGEPGLSIGNGERYYSGGGAWLWEIGLSGAFPPIEIGRGALSFYGELAWQPYFLDDGENFNFKPDFTANFRASTGLRYLWRL